MLSFPKALLNSAFATANRLETPPLHPSEVSNATLLLQVAKNGSELLVADLESLSNGDLRKRLRLNVKEGQHLVMDGDRRSAGRNRRTRDFVAHCRFGFVRERVVDDVERGRTTRLRVQPECDGFRARRRAVLEAQEHRSVISALQRSTMVVGGMDVARASHGLPGLRRARTVLGHVVREQDGNAEAALKRAEVAKELGDVAHVALGPRVKPDERV